MFDEAGEDELLLAAMMRLGAAGGALGGALGGAAAGGSGFAGGAGARGGARGAARGFKRTTKDIAEQVMELGMDAPEASQLVHRVLESVGRLVGVETRDDGSVAVRAMLGVGLGGLNPVVVTARVEQGPAGAARVSLRAAGREGLIKRHPADRALAKIAPLLPATAL